MPESGASLAKTAEERGLALVYGRLLRHIEEQREATEKTHEITRRWLDRWLAEAQPAAEALYVEATRRFVDLANGFLEKAAAVERFKEMKSVRKEELLE